MGDAICIGIEYVDIFIFIQVHAPGSNAVVIFLHPNPNPPPSNKTANKELPPVIVSTASSPCPTQLTAPNNGICP